MDNDLISRNSAIDALRNLHTHEGMELSASVDLMTACEAICSIPAVDAEPVLNGKWMERVRHEHYPSGREYKQSYCSECKMSAKEESNYCPNCGARMDGEEG